MFEAMAMTMLKTTMKMLKRTMKMLKMIKYLSCRQLSHVLLDSRLGEIGVTIVIIIQCNTMSCSGIVIILMRIRIAKRKMVKIEEG